MAAEIMAERAPSFSAHSLTRSVKLFPAAASLSETLHTYKTGFVVISWRFGSSAFSSSVHWTKRAGFPCLKS